MAIQAHRGSPDYASLLLAQLDSATKEEVLPCSVQEGVKASPFPSSSPPRCSPYTLTLVKARPALSPHPNFNP